MYHDLVLLGKTLSLYLVDPNWKSAVRVTPSLAVDVSEATSTREERAPRQEVLRLDVEATFFLDKETHTSLQREVALPRSDFVAIPFFPDRLLPGDWNDRMWDSEYVVNYDESGYAVYLRSALPGSFTRKWLAPLLVGRLKERPKLTLITDEAATFTLKFTERSPWAFRGGPVAATVGANWPESLTANWREAPEDWTEDRIEYFEVGDGRTEAVAGSESAPRRLQRCLFTLTSRAQIRTLLNFYLARKGQTQSFLVPWLARPGTDTPDTPYQVKVRFAEAQLSIDFTTDSVANGRVVFEEVPWELNPVLGETPVQAPTAYLYRFSYQTPGGKVYTRFTSWERPLVRTELSASATYISDVGIAHDAIQSATDFSDGNTVVQAAVFDGNPLLRILQRRTDAPLVLEIFQCDPSNPDSAQLRYVGEVRKPRTQGHKIVATSVVLGGRLDTKVPYFYRGPKCNFQFCGPGCGLNMDNIRLLAVAETQTGKEVLCRLYSNPGNLNGTIPDLFANGSFEYSDQQFFQSRHIVRSAPAYFSGISWRISLTLKRELVDFVPETLVKIFPDCSGTKSECQTRWNNYLRFGGHPHVGERNLSLPQRDVSAPTGKK